MADNNTNLPISWLLGKPVQKKFRSCITFRHVFKRTKKPSHATVPLKWSATLGAFSLFFVQYGTYGVMQILAAEIFLLWMWISASL